MTADPKQFDFAGSIKQLEEINAWFQNEDLDLDEGLRKLKTGKDLINKCRARLHEVENEFVDIKKEFSQDEQAGDQAPAEPDDGGADDGSGIPF